jgi:hypothetical protein
MNAHERALDDALNFPENDQTKDALFEQDPVEDFQMVSQTTVQANYLNAVSIPLPTDVPPPPNLSSLPAHILHSGTVETLIGQNEDLMARLKVNIRRNSILEQQIMEQDRLHARLKGEHASLIAQYQVLCEKSEMIREKSQTFDIQMEELRDQIDLSDARAQAAAERSQELRAGLVFEKAYRRRIRAWVRPYLTELKRRLTDTQSRISFLDRQLSTREAVIGDLRERLGNAEKVAQVATVKNNQDQALLVESYESRMSLAEAGALKSRAESALLREKASRLDEAVSARANAENRIISLERKNQDMERTLGEELNSIQTQLANFRVEAKELAAEVMAANAERDRARLSESEAKSELGRAQDQFESLQAVWAEAQKKFEASKLQQDALNKLNQELSRQLKTERKARESGSLVAASPVVTESTSIRLEKIDSILAELECGYSKARGVDPSIEFIEDERSMVESVQPALASEMNSPSL